MTDCYYVVSICFYRQVAKDYDIQTQLGLLMSMNILPGCLAKKDDRFGGEDLAGDWSDPEAARVMAEKILVKAKRIFANEPQMQLMVKGNFEDVVRRGHIKL